MPKSKKPTPEPNPFADLEPFAPPPRRTPQPPTLTPPADPQSGHPLTTVQVLRRMTRQAAIYFLTTRPQDAEWDVKTVKWVARWLGGVGEKTVRKWRTFGRRGYDAADTAQMSLERFFEVADKLGFDIALMKRHPQDPFCPVGGRYPSYAAFEAERDSRNPAGYWSDFAPMESTYPYETIIVGRASAADELGFTVPHPDYPDPPYEDMNRRKKWSRATMCPADWLARVSPEYAADPGQTENLHNTPKPPTPTKPGGQTP